MNTYIGKQSRTMTEWCERKYGGKVTLTVRKEYDSDPGSQAEIYVDEVRKEFDVPIELTKGHAVTLRAFPPESYAVEKFLYWSDDPTHGVYSSTRQFTPSADTELTAVFHANVS